MRPSFGWRPPLAEFVGTFALVFAGTGAVVIDAETDGGIGHVGVGLTFGLVIMVMIYAVGHVSGAHFNPAVTLAFAVGRHFPWRLAPRYWGAQLLGGIAASLLVRGLFGNVADLGATLPAGSAQQSFVLEVVLTFLLMFVITAVATDVRAVGQAAAIAIGGTIGLEALFAGPISGASMNPARSLAPALVSWSWASQWLYVAGPVLGAAAAAREECEPETCLVAPVLERCVAQAVEELMDARITSHLHVFAVRRVRACIRDGGCDGGDR